MSYFEDLVAKYGKEHTRFLELQKIDKADSSEIKDVFLRLGITKQEGGEYVATLTESKSSDFDEEKLIKILQYLPPNVYTDIVKTKQFVDMDALEDAIYNNVVEASKLAPAKVTKVTQRLTIKKKKG